MFVLKVEKKGNIETRTTEIPTKLTILTAISIQEVKKDLKNNSNNYAEAVL